MFMKRLISLLLTILLIVMVALSAAEDSVTGSESTVNDFRDKLGYDFPVYGDTSCDLSPLSDYLLLLNENSILLQLPELIITHKEDCEWIYSEIGASKSIYLNYTRYLDNSKYTLLLQVPHTYRPKDEALILLIQSALGMDHTKSSKLYDSLQYNVIDDWSTLKGDGFHLSYYEPHYKNGEPGSFISLIVDRDIKTE